MDKTIGITEKGFEDYYDHLIPSVARISLTRSTFSSVLSRPNLFSFVAQKIGLQPVKHFIVEENNVDDLIEMNRSSAFLLYVDKSVHNGAGKRLFPRNELVESSEQSQLLKQISGNLIAKFVDTVVDSGAGSSSLSTTYFRIGLKEYWVETKGSGWQSNYSPHSQCRLLPEAEVEQLWSKQRELISAAKSKLDKLPLLSIDFLREIDTGEVFVNDFNLSPQLHQTPIVDVLPPQECWDQISAYISEHIDLIYDYVLVSFELPPEMRASDFILSKASQLRYLPSGSFWQCIEDESIWKYLHGEQDSERFFWRQKKTYSQAGVNQLNRKNIFTGRTYRLC